MAVTFQEGFTVKRIQMLSTRIQFPHEILSRPLFKPSFDHELDPVIEVFDHYRLRQRIECGKCGTEHLEGYLVRLRSGDESIIGGDCHEKLGEAVKEMRRQFWEKTYRPALIAHLVSEKARISELLPGFRRLWRDSRAITDYRETLYGLSSIVYERAKRQAATGDNGIYISVEQSESEIDDAIALGVAKNRDAARYMTTRIATIEGISILVTNVKRVVFDNLLNLAERFYKGDLDQWKMSELREIEVFLSELDGRLLEAQKTVEAGNRFFSEANLRNLAKLEGISPRDRRIFESIKISDLIPKSANGDAFRKSA